MPQIAPDRNCHFRAGGNRVPRDAKLWPVRLQAGPATFFLVWCRAADHGTLTNRSDALCQQEYPKLVGPRWMSCQHGRQVLSVSAQSECFPVNEPSGFNESENVVS